MQSMTKLLSIKLLVIQVYTPTTNTEEEVNELYNQVKFDIDGTCNSNCRLECQSWKY